jgi:hypothetical protein
MTSVSNGIGGTTDSGDGGPPRPRDGTAVGIPFAAGVGCANRPDEAARSTQPDLYKGSPVKGRENRKEEREHTSLAQRCTRIVLPRRAGVLGRSKSRRANREAKKRAGEEGVTETSQCILEGRDPPIAVAAVIWRTR